MSQELRESLLTLAETPREEVAATTFRDVMRTLDLLEQGSPGALPEAVEAFHSSSRHWPTGHWNPLRRDLPEQRVPPMRGGWADAFFQGRASAKYGALRQMHAPAGWKRGAHDLDHLVDLAPCIPHVDRVSLGDKASAKHLKAWRGAGPWDRWRQLALVLSKGTAKELGKLPLGSLEHLAVEVQPGALEALARVKNLDHLQSVRIHMKDGAGKGSHDSMADLEALQSASWMRGLRVASLNLWGAYEAQALAALASACGWGDSLEHLQLDYSSSLHPKTLSWLSQLKALRGFTASFSLMSEQMFTQLLESAPGLEHLVWGGPVDDAGLEALARHGGSLKVLRLHVRQQQVLYAEGGLARALRSEALQGLEEFSCELLGEEEARFLVEGGLPSLRRLRFTYIQDQARALLQADPRLSGLLP